MNLPNECRELVGRCQYKYFATDDIAPLKANCVTSVRYIFNRVFAWHLPKRWVGDLPAELISQHKAQLLKLKPSELRCGDLLFVRNKKSKRKITHLTLSLGSGKIFHCTSTQGAVIQKVEQVFERYEQTLNAKQMLNHMDDRGMYFRNPTFRNCVRRDCVDNGAQCR